MSLQPSVKAWNRFVMSSKPASYELGSARRAAAIANLYMGLANNGGINSFLTCSNDLDAAEVLDSLVAIGALTAANQFGAILQRLGPAPPATQAERFLLLERRWPSDVVEVLSPDANRDLMNALERHVLENEDFYLTLPKHPLAWDGE